MISVIVICYKNGLLLFDTLRSVLDQDYPSIEIVVANDCEDGFDVSLVENFIETQKRDNITSIKVYKNRQRLGTVKSLNKALRVVSGEYIKIIAGDDIYPSSSVFSKQIKVLENSSSFFCTGNVYECDSKMGIICENGLFAVPIKISQSKNRKKLIKYILKNNITCLSTQSMCFKKSFFERYGFFDERLILIEDLPLVVKILIEDIPFEYLNLPVICHRRNVGVSSNINGRFDAKRMLYYQDLLTYYELIIFPIREIIGKGYFRHRYRVAKFRIEYIKKNKKMFLLFKYFDSILYYFLFCRKKRK